MGSGLPQNYTPPPPSGPPVQPGPRSPYASFIAANWVGLGTLAVVLAVTDSVFISAGRRSADPALFVAWAGIQALVCVAAGGFQGVRERRWWETVIVGVIAAVALAFIGLATANSDPGSTDCPEEQSCDTAFGLGAILITIVMTPILTGVTCVGRALGGLAARSSGRSR